MIYDMYRKEIKKELAQMQAIGMEIPLKAFEEVDELSNTQLECMTVGEAADICIDIALMGEKANG